MEYGKFKNYIYLLPQFNNIIKCSSSHRLSTQYSYQASQGTKFIHKNFVKTYINYHKLKRQGMEVYFIGPFGLFSNAPQPTKEEKQKEKNEDSLYLLRKEKEKYPNRKLAAYCFADNIFISLIDPDLLRAFFVDKANCYQKSPEQTNKFKQILGDGLLFAEKDVWKRKRRLLSQWFNYQFLVELLPKVVQTTNQVLDTFQSGQVFILTVNQFIQKYNLINDTQTITATMIISTFFGANLSEKRLDGQTLPVALDTLIKDIAMAGSHPVNQFISSIFGKLPITAKDREINRKIRDFKQIALDVIKERIAEVKSSKKSSGQMDLVEALISNNQLVEAYEKDKNDSDLYSYNDLIDEFFTFFAAGMDTTGHLVGIALLLLKKYPDIEELLRQEINSVIKCDADYTSENIKKLANLHKYIIEVLRTHNPVQAGFPKVALQDHQLGPFQIKKGTMMGIMPINSYDEKIFPDPQKFDINRWTTEQTQKDYHFIPFAAGPRNCIGQHLAMFETKIIMSQFLRRFNYKIEDGFKYQFASRFLYEPKDPAFAILDRIEGK